MHPRDAASSKKMGGGSSNVAGIICPPWSEKGLTDIPKLAPLPSHLRRLCIRHLLFARKYICKRHYYRYVN